MVTKPTGNPRGRPSKPKPPPRAAHRPKEPFLGDLEKYEVAKFLAMREFTRNGAALFTSFYYGVRETRPEVIAELKTHRKVIAAAKPGYEPVFFHLGHRRKDGTFGPDTRPPPNSWEGAHWPGTVKGKEKHLHKKPKRVLSGDDDAARHWLHKMTWAYVFGQMSAFAEMVPIGNQVMFLHGLRGAILRAAGDASEAGELRHATEDILPGIERAVDAIAARLNG